MIEEDAIRAGGPACPLSGSSGKAGWKRHRRALQMQAMQSLSRSEAEA